ncbi:MAG: hypothetical protein KDD45_17300, partial [Bdellovibrionales bacterium]|nr:hypothetical protein [Bdellovibrionales bacterium]
MTNIVGAIKNLIILVFKNIGKIIFVLVVAVIFTVFLFPLNELSDLASQNVSKYTNNQYYLDFDTLKLNLLSDLGVQLGNVYVETPRTAPLTFKQFIAMPSLSAILYAKPQGTIKLKGLFKGDVEIKVSKHKEDNPNETKIERNLISVQANRLSLADLKNFLVLPVNMSGSMSLSSQIIANLEMQQTPEIQDLTINIKNFDMPQTT